MELVVARLLHIVFGVLWVGFMGFMAFFLGPALADVGPDAGKVMGALQRRRLMTVLPVFAIVTVLSGLWLYYRLSGGFSHAYMASRLGMALGTGGVLAIAAFIIGLTVTRPAMLKVMALTPTIATAPAGEREQLQAEVNRLRARGASGTKLVAIMLLLAAGLMGIARYL